MARAGKITVQVGLEIPEETAERCLQILEMWLNDNPDTVICCEEVTTADGIYRRLFCKQTREAVE